MKMTASVCTRYGSADNLAVRQIEKPCPKDNEVLIKIYASSVTAADTMMRQGSPYIGRLFLGLRKPKHPITGTGFSGVIEAIGAKVSLWRINEEVFGESVLGSGANAEYVCVPEDVLILNKPHNLNFFEAATLCDGPLTSMNMLLNLGNIQKGQKVLINGASGSLGSAGIQIAKYYGAHVTAVCSANNIELVKSLGADEVIDYHINDFTQKGLKFDIIYDSVGMRSFTECKKVLTNNGRYISPVLSFSLFIQMIWSMFLSRVSRALKYDCKTAHFSATGILAPAVLKRLFQPIFTMINEGAFQSTIDRHYPLNEISLAHKYVDTGRKKGNVVINCK